ncbi:isopentenyl phosphate kinase [Chloroflexota bacterium]
MLQFLKLGGSLITNKTRAHTARLDVLARLADEIAAARGSDPNPQLVLGHGSGSFGHVAARKYGTRQGVRTPQGWVGFAEVWRDANALHRLVVDALVGAGLPVISCPPSAAVLAQDGRVAAWELAPLRAALAAGLLPLVHGDVVFDTIRGGTILSTEDLFEHLARQLRPERILLAGIEPGVWADYPECTQLVETITSENLDHIAPALAGSAATDVTGGMDSKVRQIMALVGEISDLEALIFSGQQPGAVERALGGEQPGTLLRG